jgi:hypothetical protein
MTQESLKFPIGDMDFIDLGIVVQNNKVNKRVFFFKAVYLNRQDKMREVFIFGVSED